MLLNMLTLHGRTNGRTNGRTFDRFYKSPRETETTKNRVLFSVFANKIKLQIILVSVDNFCGVEWFVSLNPDSVLITLAKISVDITMHSITLSNSNPPCCTKCNNPAINDQCTNHHHIILYQSDVHISDEIKPITITDILSNFRQVTGIASAPRRIETRLTPSCKAWPVTGDNPLETTPPGYKPPTKNTPRTGRR